MYQLTDNQNFGVSNYPTPDSVRIVLESINANERSGNFEPFGTDALREAYDWLRILIIKKTQDLHEQQVDYESKLIEILHNEIITRWKRESEQLQTEQIQALYKPIKEEKIEPQQTNIAQPVATQEVQKEGILDTPQITLPEPVKIEESPKEKIIIPQTEKTKPTILDLIAKSKTEAIKPKPKPEPKETKLHEKPKPVKIEKKKDTNKIVKEENYVNKKQKTVMAPEDIKKKFPDPETFRKLLNESKKGKVTSKQSAKNKKSEKPNNKKESESTEFKIVEESWVDPEKFKNLPTKQARRKMLKELRKTGK